MARLCMLLLLSVGTIFLSQLLINIEAVPTPDFDVLSPVNDTKEVAETWWEKAKNVFRSKPTKSPTQCTFQNGSWNCPDKITSSDDTKVKTHSSTTSFSRGIAAVNGFAGHLWNSTKDTFSFKDKNVLDKPTKWWKNFKSYFSQATTVKPPTRFAEGTYTGDLYSDKRYKREAKPCMSGKQSSDPEASRA